MPFGNSLRGDNMKVVICSCCHKTIMPLEYYYENGNKSIIYYCPDCKLRKEVKIKTEKG